EVAPKGVLRRDAESAWRMLQDPEQSGVVVVTLPEELPASETLELTEELRSVYGLPVAGLVVNGCLPPLFSEQEIVDLAGRSDLLAPTTSLTLAELAARRAVREKVQAENLHRLASLNLPQILLPLHGGPEAGSQRVQVLSRYFSEPAPSLFDIFG